jgi:hypothetical protein
MCDAPGDVLRRIPVMLPVNEIMPVEQRSRKLPSLEQNADVGSALATRNEA